MTLTTELEGYGNILFPMALIFWSACLNQLPKISRLQIDPPFAKC